MGPRRQLVVRTSKEVGRRGARLLAAFVRRRPGAVLGLATGSTMVPFYRELVRLHLAGQVDFAGVTTFNLDEYYGLGPEDPRSFHYYMQQHFFRWVNVPPKRRFLPDGLAQDPEAECRRYEALLAQSGGLDLQVLGIGVNGHIGFNEPGTHLGSGTQILRLRPETVARNEGLLGGLALPEMAISVGIKTIMHARRLLLLASGAEKAEAVRRALAGPVSEEVPASALQLHPALTVILDAPAAAGLGGRPAPGTASRTGRPEPRS
ncbi:MAG: glucosamine-6-phosphate deaminase [Chitinophagales bacterium]